MPRGASSSFLRPTRGSSRADHRGGIRSEDHETTKATNPMEGNTMFTDDQFNELAEQMVGYVASTEDLHNRIKQVERKVDRVRVDNLASGDVAKMALEKMHGPDGAAEWCRGFGGFIRAAWLKQRTGRVPQEYAAMDSAGELELTNHVTKGYDTYTDVTAGFLVPERWWPELDVVRQLYGDFAARCRTINVRPGQAVNIGALSEPTMVWRVAQNADITEVEPTASQEVLRPALLGGFCQFANELMELPDINLGPIIAGEFGKAMARAEEIAMLSGDEDAGGDDPPSDGLLVMLGTNDQGNVATMSVENLLTFIDACVTDDDNAAGDNSNLIIMHNLDWLTLIGSATMDTAHLIDLETGRFGGMYKIVKSLACKISTQRYVALVNRADFWIARWPGYRIDFDPYGLFIKNATRMRVIEHLDWGVPSPGRVHFATVAA